MKKTPISAVCVLLCLILVLFSACEVSVDLSGKNNTTSATADSTDGSSATVKYVVEETDSSGKVVATKTEIVPAEDVKKSDKFFSYNSDTTSVSGISESRYNNANSGKAESTTVNNKKDDNNSSVSTTKVSDNRTDDEIIASKKYVVSGRIVSGGVTSEYKIAQSGSKYALISAYNGTPIGVIANDTNIYILQPGKKTYFEIPKSMLAGSEDESIDSVLNGDFNTDDKTEKSRGTKKIDGKELSYIEYDDGSCTYYSGKTLIMSTSSDGSTIYYDEISGDVPNSFFYPPSSYKSVPLTADALSEFTDAIEGESDTTAKAK